MKLLWALFAAIWFAPLVSAAEGVPESAAACFEQAALQPRTVFDVVAATYTTVVERGLSIREINVIRPVHLPPQAIAHGLTLADFRVNSTTRSEATRWGPDGRVCAWIGGVVVNLTPASLRIYIPKEYRPNSCESRQLLLHEMEHERLFRLGLERAVEKMRFALAHARDLPGPLTPVDAAGSRGSLSPLQGHGGGSRAARSSPISCGTPDWTRSLWTLRRLIAAWGRVVPVGSGLDGEVTV